MGWGWRAAPSHLLLARQRPHGAVSDALWQCVIQRGGRCGGAVCGLLCFTPAGRGGRGRTRRQSQLLFFFGISDDAFRRRLVWELFSGDYWRSPSSCRTKSL
jgi:hypothetical protein